MWYAADLDGAVEGWWSLLKCVRRASIKGVCVFMYVSLLVCVVYVFEVWYHVQFAFIILHISAVPPPPSVSPSLLIPQAERMYCV